MEKRKVIDILEYLSVNYTTFGDPVSKIEVWNQVLKDYNYEETINRINEMMTRREFLTTPPTLMAIVGPLTKSNEKISLDGKLFGCQFCKRLFNSIEEMEQHEDRCRSIRYIERQYQRFGKDSINKRELYEMQEDDFQTKYKQLLKFVYEHSYNETEKNIIASIFNPPNPDKAKEIIGA